MFITLFRFLKEHHAESVDYVKSHFDGKGIDGMTNEDLRDYYLNLGRADMCQEALECILSVFGFDGSIDDFSQQVDRYARKRS